MAKDGVAGKWLEILTERQLLGFFGSKKYCHLCSEAINCLPLLVFGLNRTYLF